jgi:TolB-like protein
LRYLFEDIALDTERRELLRGADAVPVEPQVFDLLVYLIRNRERVVSRDDLLASVWEGRLVSESALNTRIHLARWAVGDSGEDQRLIKTFPRKGFRFVGPVREDQGTVSVVARQAQAAAPETIAVPLSLPDRPSIAVLPFANMSGDPEQEYFADGMVDDILAALSRVRWLFVIARQSSFLYKVRAADVQQIGRELGVRYMVEGSVRKAGNRVRIVSQLIGTETGAHIWADRYEGDLRDIFALQDEITERIVAAVE